MSTQPSTSGQPAATPQPRPMTTAGKLAAALAVPCDVHQVPAGQPCPLIELQACSAPRRRARRHLTPAPERSRP